MHRRLVAACLFAGALLALPSLVGMIPQPAIAADANVATVPAPTTPAGDSKTMKALGGEPSGIKLTPEELRFTELTNVERKSRKLNELTVAPLLVQIAREKSKEMYDLNYWGHVSPVEEKRTAMTRLLYYLKDKPQSMLVGENLYYCSEVRVDDGQQALMNSPTHRKNILNPEYRYIGIGTFTAPDGRFWTTEIFLQAEF